MDELFDKVKKDIIQMIKESNDKGDLTINFLMIAKYFERIGDHGLNIAESLYHIRKIMKQMKMIKPEIEEA